MWRRVSSSPASPGVAFVGLSSAASSGVQLRHKGAGPGTRMVPHATKWYACYPDYTTERERDMYHSYYPYLFDHGDKMSLYPKIPKNPREWQPGQLLTTYDAIREDKYDAFIRLRKKFPELYEDTQAWDNPVPFGEFNQFYSVRFGMIGMKAFTTREFDEHGNEMKLTAFWFPDNQVVAHRTGEFASANNITIGAMNVPAEFHKPYITAAYKAKRVPPKHVSASFVITPDSYVPVGTRLDVRHFKVGQEVNVEHQELYYGMQGAMFRHGYDGGYVWLGDSKWQRRPGALATEGGKRVLPGKQAPGVHGGGVIQGCNMPIYRIDYKNSLIYVVGERRSEIGSYAKFTDVKNIHGKTSWNERRGFPPFPTFIPPAGEDVSAMATEDCQLISLPLLHRLKDDHGPQATISQTEIDDARAVKPATAPPKKELIDLKGHRDARKKFQKALSDARKKDFAETNAIRVKKQDETRRKKLMARRRVK